MHAPHGRKGTDAQRPVCCPLEGANAIWGLHFGAHRHDAPRAISALMPKRKKKPSCCIGDRGFDPLTSRPQHNHYCINSMLTLWGLTADRTIKSGHFRSGNCVIGEVIQVGVPVTVPVTNQGVAQHGHSTNDPSRFLSSHCSYGVDNTTQVHQYLGRYHGGPKQGL